VTGEDLKGRDLLTTLVSIAFVATLMVVADVVTELPKVQLLIDL